MLDISLGAGIMWASLFLALGTVLVTWINNLFRSKQKGNNPNSSNSFIRRGEFDQAIKSFHQRLDDMQTENRDWWKELNKKIDNIQSDLNELRETNINQGQRISALETKWRD